MTNETNKDYSLLREFNLEQAKTGDAILYMHHRTDKVFADVEYRGHTVAGDFIFIEYIGGSGRCIHKEELKMKPLTWIEGRPVYKNDVLYVKSPCSDYEPLTIESTFEPLSHKSALWFTTGMWAHDDELTWTKPKEKHVHQELIDAWKNGAKIQYRSKTLEDWCDTTPAPAFCETNKYRIKPPESKKKSGWINIWKSNIAVSGVHGGSFIYQSKDLAVNGGYDVTGKIIDTVEIHWTE